MLDSQKQRRRRLLLQSIAAQSPADTAAPQPPKGRGLHRAVASSHASTDSDGEHHDSDEKLVTFDKSTHVHRLNMRGGANKNMQRKGRTSGKSDSAGGAASPAAPAATSGYGRFSAMLMNTRAGGQIDPAAVRQESRALLLQQQRSLSGTTLTARAAISAAIGRIDGEVDPTGAAADDSEEGSEEDEEVDTAFMDW